MQVTLILASAGFVGAIAALALGAGLLTVLNLMLAAFAAGDLVGTLVKLALYRRGV